MSDSIKASISEFKDLVLKVLNAETNNFSELAQIAGLNTAKDFAGANLSYTDLKRAELSGANLSQSDLRHADLSAANLTNANLSGANLSYANLNGANLNGANLNGANLNGANLSDTKVNYAQFENSLGLSENMKTKLRKGAAIYVPLLTYNYATSDNYLHSSNKKRAAITYSPFDDEKRVGLAARLAEMKVIQELIIANEETLLSQVTDSEIQYRLQDMLDSDHKNLGILETVIVQCGIQGEPRQATRELVEKIQQMMQSSELSLYDKFAQHELLKHAQVMTGIMLHKAAQVVGADVDLAFGPLNTVNFENRAHQEQLKGMLEQVGTRELTGQEADQGLWARVQDAMAAFSGVVGSVVTQTSDKQDMNVQDVIRADHNKVNTLFTELLQSNDPQKIQEYFGQIYKDLSAHAEAEEQVVYPRVRPFYGEGGTQELYDEQAEMKRMLEEIKANDPSTSEFKDKVRQLMDAVGDHIRQEESTMFAAIRNNLSSDESEQLATDFKIAKGQIQARFYIND